MLSVPAIVPEAFFLGVTIALIFGIAVVLVQLQHGTAKLVHKKRKK